jgi:hypothetical protein
MLIAWAILFHSMCYLFRIAPVCQRFVQIDRLLLKQCYFFFFSIQNIYTWFGSEVDFWYFVYHDVAYVVGGTSNGAYDDHTKLNVAITICGYYSQYWYQNVRK